MFEALEPRRLYRTPVLHERAIFNLVNGTLAVSGTRYDDAISVHRTDNGLALRLNGHTVIVRDKARRAVIYGGRGDDRIDFGGEDGEPDSIDIGISAYIDGGIGNDTLQGGEAHGDTLLGDTGDDTLSGVFNHDPQDYHDGGPGDDRLYYGGTMYGGTGHDVAYADYDHDPLVSGLEGLYRENEQEGLLVVPRDQWRSDLYVRDGRLVFVYRTQQNEATTLDGPFVRDDGQFGLREHSTYIDRPREAVPPSRIIRNTFDLAEATRRGIVLYFASDSVADFRDNLAVLIRTR